jgi:hypothetical protein
VSLHRPSSMQSIWQLSHKLNRWVEGVRGEQSWQMNLHWNVRKGLRQLVIWTSKVKQILPNFLFLQFSNVDVMNNLDAVGINLGHDHTTIGAAISNLRKVEHIG